MNGSTPESDHKAITIRY